VTAANPELEKKKLPALKLLSEEDWRRKDQKGSSGAMFLDPDAAGALPQLLLFQYVM